MRVSLIKRNGSKKGTTANMQMNDQEDNIRKWLESTAGRPEPSGLIGIGIDVHEADIADQSPGGGADIAAARDDGQRRPAEGGDQQPRSAIVDAQQQPWIAA